MKTLVIHLHGLCIERFKLTDEQAEEMLCNLAKGQWLLPRGHAGILREGREYGYDLKITFGTRLPKIENPLAPVSELR